MAACTRRQCSFHLNDTLIQMLLALSIRAWSFINEHVRGVADSLRSAKPQTNRANITVAFACFGL